MQLELHGRTQYTRPGFNSHTSLSVSRKRQRSDINAGTYVFSPRKAAFASDLLFESRFIRYAQPVMEHVLRHELFMANLASKIPNVNSQITRIKAGIDRREYTTDIIRHNDFKWKGRIAPGIFL